jgi:phosphatidylinositol 4-kinase B
MDEIAIHGLDSKVVPSSLLLRLFESEYFDSRLAIYYLHLYPSKTGVQHYLTGRLRQFPLAEIEFLLPQLTYIGQLEYDQ